MFIKNNSKNEWKDYNCGGDKFITIKPESTFEVDDKTGALLLRLLGAETWLVEVPAPEKKEEAPVEEAPVEEAPVEEAPVEEAPKKKEKKK